ncbi:MAG: DNA polymerase I, partial [Deltaproteobacteria bacterium]|nr:DNA polymerase I [Deltaproteobacteria bacterium]
TTSLKVLAAELVGLSFSTQAGKGYYLPLGHHTEELQLSREHVLHELKPILESTHPLKIAQNFKYDYQILKMQGIEVKGLCSDTMIASYLLDPAASHNMDAIAKKYLDYQCVSFEEITQGGKFNFSQISLADATRYSAEDAEVTFRLYQHLNPLIQKNHLEKLQNEIEVPLSKVLANMELSGIKIDREFLKSLQSEFKQRLEVLDKKIIECAGEPFNINSTKQLATILFEKLKLPAKKKTKTGFSTDVDVLTDLAKMHELPAQILLYRGLAKLKSTYVDALLETADLKTDRVHTSFNQTIAETGRLSSTDPNLQNIPIRSEEGKKIRRAFIAEKGFQLLSADYSQIELRILAHFSQDEHLVKAMNEGIDIHRLTAASLFKLDPSQVSSDMRAIGKTVNFGVIYGQTAFGLSQQLSISPATAKEYIDHYFAQYPGVQVFREKVLSEARENGFVRTLYGRWRQVQDIHNKNQNVKAFAERMAFNTVIQGSAADLIKLAMIRIENEIL